ncbi:methyl-CpG-binding domain-containing protein 13-like isoform X2 [Durio zibethinus]|uniref:Methyl-CpG-binding domain-containing protein 13-like isoform X2 n=1 Tax=Durio zibethinus TaxID=66656 RepID=A0A6P6A554_DURZI|nr:methyl-CpG-binding domain-containing protein 13-like isoform X2 [Durio zibethinus]
MSEKTSTDWLPPGWTLQFKFQKTGRRITHYVNLATGQKFFTKDDLILYTKTGSTQSDDQQSTLRQNTVAKANDRPEWLPKNWLMEVKTHKSGAKIGKHYKIYIDPLTGSRFYSKPKVFGFLSNVEQESSKSEAKKITSHFTSKTVVKGNEHPEWLPQNWFMEVKAHKSGAKIGKHYKVYVDPSTGFRFHSKPQVFYFLNHTEQKSSKPKRKKRASHSTSKVVIKKSTADDLPAGWVKEVKIKRDANGVRRDPYYTDPASGYVFRSKKAVLRYLETGEIGRDAFLPKNKHSDDQNLISKDKLQLPAAKTQKVKHPAARRQLFTGEETSDRSILSDLEAETFQKGQSKKGYTETGIATASILQISQGKGSVENAIKRNPENPETAEKSSRSSSVAQKTSKRKQGKIFSVDNVLVLTAAADVQEKNLLESGTQNRSNLNFKNSSKSKNKRELDLPRRFSSRLARLAPQLVASGLELAKPCQNETSGPCVLEDEAPQQLNVRSNAEVAKQASAYSTVSDCGLAKKTIKPIEDKDVLGKQPQMFETSDPKSEVRPFFCSDPCLEFAIKTVKGAIPLDDAANEGLVSTPASNALQEKNLGKSIVKSARSNTETKHSSKFKKMKEPGLPRWSSKRLPRHESELVANGVSTEVALQNATTKTRKNEPKPPCVLVDKATWQLNIGPTCTNLPNQASAAAVSPEINNIRRNEDKAILGEEPQMLETQKGCDSKSELQSFFCSDPCLEFAIKTLTGAIPLEDAINEGLVSPPIANIQQQKNLAETRIEKSSCRKTLFNSIRSKNNDGSLLRRSSKRLAGHSPELVASLSNEQALKIADRKSCNSKAIRNADLTSVNLTDKASQQLEIGPRMALERRDFTYRTTVFHVESSNKSKEPHQNQTAPTEVIGKPGLQSAIPFQNSWSDPCFGFAFKTVTGSSPAEDSFAFQSHFNQQFDSSGSQRDGNFALPDNGLPNVFQSGISSHFDATAQPVMQQQFPVNPSFLPPGNVSLPTCGTASAQQPYRKGKRNFQAR